MYTPLYIKTDNSLQKSIIKIDSLISYAKQNNISSLSITDDNMYGVMDFYNGCKANNIKPIIGLEVSVDDKTIILYAINYNGYKNLVKICTLKSENNITTSILEKYSSDLVCIVPYESLSVYNSLCMFYKNIYKGYSNLDECNLIKENNKIYLSETLCIKKEDCKYIKYMNAIRDNVFIDEIVDTNYDNYILLEDEYKNKYNLSIESNNYITNLCNVEIPFHQQLMPKYTNPDNMDSYSYLKKKCIEGMKIRFGQTVSEKYRERLKYELEVISKMNFCDYFLIVSDYVKYAKENNIIVGTGRGSAVGSLVSYCLMITDVDPIKYDLLFERFLNPERISMPDIDIDFENDRREDVINYCIKKYGEKRVVPIITFGTLGAKQVVKDVGKAMNIDSKVLDNISRVIDSKLSLKENYDSNKILRDLISRNQLLEECYKIALKFEGLKRHTSVHAAGIVMSNIDLDNIIPLDKSHGFYISGYDMKYLEELGLLKMDFLAIKYLSTIHNIIDSINSEYNKNISFDNITLNDKKVIDLFNKADTVGIFQFESLGMINFLKKLKVTSLNDLFAAIALFRPGPMKNIPTYINRKNNKEKFDYLHKDLEKILKSTYGIIIYQEQIMQIAQVMADYTLGEADILRKAMSKKKKDLLLKEKEKFSTRALNKGYDKDLIDRIFSLMIKFAEYGFNKSHSIGYSIIAYKMAYLKAYYPKNFITYLLSMEANDTFKIKKYSLEAKKNNVEILLPDINLSSKKYVSENKGIRYPLSNIKNVGMVVTDLILKERSNGPFTDIYDFIKRCYGKAINKKVIESLIYVGAFSSFGYNRKTLINNLDLIINYGELIRDLSREYALEPEIVIFDEYSEKEILSYELEYLGLYLTNNPIVGFKQNYSNVTNLDELELNFDKNINTVVYVDNVKSINTKKGDKMQFLDCSDEVSQVDIILFPKVYSKYNDIKQGDTIYVSGKVEKRFDKYQIVANTINKLD